MTGKSNRAFSGNTGIQVQHAGLLATTAHHAFRPSETVSRSEFGVALARLTRLLGLSASPGPPISPLDVLPGSPLCLELQPVLGYVLLPLNNAGNFDIRAQVTGEEAVNTAEKLLVLFTKRRPDGLSFPQAAL